ncbi:hypothetical protein [Rhodococcus qingshengii]|uniref:hypothetical protein n=1 Tax=Rhodococcus qingshengii TaxID=334542 RepID=UPI001C5DDF26|nr:hypothetical protein [Rhodococcus qingshengii]MBW4813354.1 hypothetical protein [Rhodococcus qingshengii]
MSVITEDFRRLDGVAPFPDDLAFVYFTVPRRRENAAGTWVVVPVEVKCRLVAGKLTSPNLDPGEATVRIGPHGPTYKIIIPATDARLWDLIEMYEPADPPVVSLVKQYLEDMLETRDDIDASLAEYSVTLTDLRDSSLLAEFRAQQAADRAEAAEGVVSDEAVAELVNPGTATKAALDATYAPLGSTGGVGLTKDPETGMYAISPNSTLTKDAITGMYPIGV